MRSVASIALTRSGASLDEIARVTGRSTSSASAWRDGTRVPARDARALIAERWPEIPADAWDEMPPAAPPRATAPPRVIGGVAGSRERSKGLAVELDDRVTAELEALATADVTPGKRVAMLGELTRMQMQLGRLTGAAALNEREILASPAWLVVERTILDALDEWPDAQAAAADALEALRGAPA